MEDKGEGSAMAALSCSGNRRVGNETGGPTASASFKSEGKTRTRSMIRPSLDADNFINLLHGSDPVKVKLNRLENEVRGAMWFDLLGLLTDVVSSLFLFFLFFVIIVADKDRELGESHAEMKSLRLSE